MSEWTRYEGTDEQIEEMRNAEHGFITSNTSPIWNKQVVPNRDAVIKLMSEADQYLICGKHPLADMIERWARTGQPVYWRRKDGTASGKCIENGITIPHPFYAPDYFDYSFTPFEEEK